MAERSGRFEWHPRWAGKSGDEARAELLAEIASDQRAYALALTGADLHEADALASVVPLERKWGALSLDWAELDPAALADAALAAEWERESRREMTPLADLRGVIAAPAAPLAFDEYPEKSLRLTDSKARLVVLLVVLALAALLAWRVFA